MERSKVLPSTRMRITELVVWDGALAFLVIGLLIANRVLAPAPVPESAAQPRTPQVAEEPEPEAQPEAEAPTRRGRRARRGARRADPSEDRLAALEREALAASDGPAALDVLERAAALAEEPGYAELRTRVFEHVAALEAGPAAWPRAQHLADVRDAAGLERLIAALPAGAERSGFDAELKLARRPAPASGRVKAFRPGWELREGGQVALASDLPAAQAQELDAALEALLELAERLGGPAPGPLTFTVELAPTAELAQPGTLRRADEPADDLLDRARWALGAHLCAGWKLPEALARGVCAYLAGATDARGRLSRRAEGWLRLLRTHELRGDGQAALDVLSGEADWVLTWGWVWFAAQDDSSPAQRAREGLRASLDGGGALQPWDASRAAEAERRWARFLGVS